MSTALQKKKQRYTFTGDTDGLFPSLSKTGTVIKDIGGLFMPEATKGLEDLNNSLSSTASSFASVSFFHFITTKSGIRIMPKRKAFFNAMVVAIQSIIDDYNIHYTNKNDRDPYLRQKYLSHELFRRGYLQTVFSEKEGTVIWAMYERTGENR